jgi:integrase
LRPRTVRGIRITLNTALASLAAMWVLLVTSGMRPSEVLGLPWPAVDLEAGVVSIYQKLIKVEYRAVLADGTKVDHTGGAVAQVIVLAPVAATMLRAWRTAQIKEPPRPRPCPSSTTPAAPAAAARPSLATASTRPSSPASASHGRHVTPGKACTRLQALRSRLGRRSSASSSR